jgi:hypothetical protein
VALDADGIPLRTAAKRGLVGQQRACSEALEGVRPESFGQKAYKEASGSFRKRLHEKACRTHRKIGSYDLVMDRTDDGRRLKMLAVVEECTRPAVTVSLPGRGSVA